MITSVINQLIATTDIKIPDEFMLNIVITGATNIVTYCDEEKTIPIRFSWRKGNKFATTPSRFPEWKGKEERDFEMDERK